MLIPAQLRTLAAIALVWCQTMPLLSAPPVNDNLVGAPILHAIDTSAESSTTVEATMEGSEPFPAGYSAGSYRNTVWWEWTPNTINFSGAWYELETTGSAINTVMSLWTGTNYSTPLALVHVNDDNIAITSDGTNSRIRFFAAKDVTYRIAVASRTAVHGTVMLKGASLSGSNYFRVTAATFTPSIANVASAVTVTADVSMAGASPDFESGTMTLYTPTNTVLATAPVSRFSGTISNGVYRMTLNIPAGSPVGSCRWGISVINTTANPDKVSSYGWEGMTPLPAGVPTAISVINDPFAAWASANSLAGPSALRDADPDADGLKNLLEYECGLNPQSGAMQTVALSGATITQTGLPEVTVAGAGDQRRLRIVYLRKLGDSTVSATVQFSDNLSGWSNATATPTVIATSATHEAVVVEDVVFVPARTSRYAKVRYLYTP